MSSCGNNYGSKCNFSCTVGYRLNGSSTVTCVASGNRPPGKWDNPAPVCQGRLQLKYINLYCFVNYKVSLMAEGNVAICTVKLDRLNEENPTYSFLTLNFEELKVRGMYVCTFTNSTVYWLLGTKI